MSIIQPPPRGEIVERLGSPLMDTVLFTMVMNETGIEREREREKILFRVMIYDGHVRARVTK